MVYKKMVGLSIVLESTSSPQIIISKVSIPSPSVSSSHYAPTSRTATSFLDVCSLCKKNLSPGEDIYMYKGDGAFCSVECRSRQICMDEENVFREKNCSLIASFIAGSASRRLNSGGQ